MLLTDREKSTLLSFLHAQKVAVISTVDLSKNPVQPESALVAFADLENFEIVFETFIISRKYQNLHKNPHISLVVGTDPSQLKTLQYEGIAHEIPATESEKYISIFLAKKTPATEQVLRNPQARLFKVTPTWIRFSDYSQGKPLIIEGIFQKNGEIECSC